MTFNVNDLPLQIAMAATEFVSKAIFIGEGDGKRLGELFKKLEAEADNDPEKHFWLAARDFILETTRK